MPVMRNRPDIYSTIVAVIQDEIKSGSFREDSRDGNVGRVEDDEEEEEDEEDCMRIIEETMVDPKSLPGRTYFVYNFWYFSVFFKVGHILCATLGPKVHFSRKDIFFTTLGTTLYLCN